MIITFTLISLSYGEGKTDCMHLQAAFESFRQKGKYTNLSLAFYRYRPDDEVNNRKLYDLCSTRSLQKNDDKIEIYIFDRDVPSFISKVSISDDKPKYWGQNVYSMVLPILSRRPFDELCIEHYYSDSDLLQKDKMGHRIFLSTEFDKKTARHLSLDLSYKNKNYLNSNYPRILDCDVFNSGGHNVALSKMAFATNVLQHKKPFDSMDFSAFSAIFDIIEDIARGHYEKNI